MPSKKTLEAIKPANPFAICSAQGLKQGTAKFERCVEHVTQSALARKRKDSHQGKKKS